MPNNFIVSSVVRRNPVLLSPASFRRFFREEDPVIVVCKFIYGVGVATAVLSWTGLNYWVPDLRRHRLEYTMARRERLKSIKTDMEMLERDIDAIKAKQLHSRVQKDDNKTKAKADPVRRAV